MSFKMITMRTAIFTFLLIICFTSCTSTKSPKAKHVVLIGLDAMGSRALQRATTPTFNKMIQAGAVTIRSRSVRPTSSSQNWMSMVSGATPEMHGVTSNDWDPSNLSITPALKNKKGLFPTIFDAIKEQRPAEKVFLFYEWSEQDRMYDVSVVDKAVTGFTGTETFLKAQEAFFKDKPALLFVSINETDEMGHAYGHESEEFLHCVSHYDALVGDFIRQLEAADMLDDTVILVTADHGGHGKSHGSDQAADLTVPILLYGGSVTKGKLITEPTLICDVAATAAQLLQVQLPRGCAGNFIAAAFEPATAEVYLPMPFITPMTGLFKDKKEISIRADIADATIYYTTDGSIPTCDAKRYSHPFTLKESAVVRAVTCLNGQYSSVAEAMIRILPNTTAPAIAYKYYANYAGTSVPDFKKMGRPTRTGFVHEFSLDELDVENKDHFAVEFSAHLQVDSAGLYSFGIMSDDGALLFVDDALLIDNDGSHSSEMKRNSISLSAGKHTLRVAYFENYMGQKLELYYGSTTIPFQVVPFAKLIK